MEVLNKKRAHINLWETSSSGITFGHISLEIGDCYISFWPVKGTTSCQILNERCLARWYNSIAEEINEVKKHPITLIVYRLDATAIESWWKAFLSKEPKYEIREQNCASVVYKALRAGSSWFGENVKDCAGIKTPRQIFQYVKDGYNKDTKIDCGCLCTHCLYLTPYRLFGFVSPYVYNSYLFFTNKWKYLKGNEVKMEQNKTVENSKPDDELIHLSHTKDSVIDTISLIYEQDIKIPVQEEILDNCIDLSCKRTPHIVSLSGKAFQPSEETNINTADPVKKDLGVRFRISTNPLEADDTGY